MKTKILPDFQMCISVPLKVHGVGIFGAAHGWGRGQKGLPSLKSDTHPTMMKLGTVITYLKKIQKIYESRDTHPEFY